MASRPSQKIGSEIPTSEPSSAARSSVEFRRVAAITPATTPRVADTTIARKASFRVNGKRCPRRTATGCRDWIEMPRSPVTAWRRYARNWTGSGWFNPCSCRMRASTSSVASSPARMRAGSPGTSWRSPKETRLTPRSTGRSRISRRTIYVTTVSRQPRTRRGARGCRRWLLLFPALLGEVRELERQIHDGVHLLRRPDDHVRRDEEDMRCVVDDDLLRLTQRRQARLVAGRRARLVHRIVQGLRGEEAAIVTLEGGHAGLLQQLLGLLGVVGVARELGIAVLERSHDAGNHLGIALVDALDDGLPVHGMVQRPPHAHVVEGLLLHVDRDEERAGRGNRLDDEAGILAEPRDILGGDVDDEVRVAGLEHEHPGGILLHRLHYDAVEERPAAPVGIAPLDNHAVALDPLDELEGPRADRMKREILAPLLVRGRRDDRP